MAIAALSIGATGEAPALQRARAMGVAVRFAVGHALLLALGAGALIVLGWSLPLVVERGGEMLGGILLIVVRRGRPVERGGRRVYGHTPRHGHETRRIATCTSGGAIIIRCRRRTRTCRPSSARRSRSAACAR